ncbi:hypothetical protein Y032_0219g2489 [Ancylostoma ceylanicum]|uniref:Bestrophin homolog n=1 Tax=Ancylostoma ceylanicum TaxID=53326 RepID=A0A016SIX8_9BILA|nr:hypothetical protein Y032_0219g2489 [Ancylostoma ceylanicum]
MTVTYSLDVANSSFFCLYRLLFRWKGSIWKSIWAELLVWIVLYAILSVVYRLALSKQQREVFEDLCVFFDTYSSFIPITFMLGFYVSAVFTRWWQIFDNIGWIDTPALWITQYVRGQTERARMMRRTLIRYLVLTQAIVFRDVAAGVRKRFPTMNHLVTAGLMTEKELEEFDSVISLNPKYWVPMHWVFSLIRVAKEEGKIPGEMVYVDFMEKIRQYRVQVLSLTLYDWVPVPLVYTQVVHLAVRMYFAVALLGRQYLQPGPNRTLNIDSAKTIDLYVPVMSILQFIFFVGWMKVAEVLLNPLGEDDDDFECNYILDRNLEVGFNVVDKAYDRFPNLVRDQFWEDSIPEPLYTAESAQRTINPQVGSCVDMATEDDSYMLRPRRRTISRSSHWDGEYTTDDVIPVIGMEKIKENNSSAASGESNAFSQSFLSQSRRISDMFRRMQGPRKASASNGMSRRYSRKGNHVSDIEHHHSPDIKSNHSSSSSLDVFGQSFHNNVSPPTLNGAHGISKSVPDSLKISLDDTEGKKSPTSPTSNVAWFVDELPVIEEEQEKRRVSEEGSVKSANSSGSRIGGIRSLDASSLDPLPTVPENEEKKQGPPKNGERKEDQGSNDVASKKE